MSFYTDPITRKAVKAHRCTYCGEDINKGDSYTYQSGVHDNDWFESKMHHECFTDFCENGDGEYSPYCNDRPREEV